MTKLVGAFALLSLTTAVAWADDAPATADPVVDEPTVDCETLEGDAKTECEAKAAADAAGAAEKDSKGKGLKKSEDNRMESLDDE
jgi:hypothetical protein